MVKGDGKLETRVAIMEVKIKNYENVIDRCDKLIDKISQLVVTQEVQAETISNLKNMFEAAEKSTLRRQEAMSESMGDLSKSITNMEKNVSSVTKLAYGSPIAVFALLAGVSRLS